MKSHIKHIRKNHIYEVNPSNIKITCVQNNKYDMILYIYDYIWDMSISYVWLYIYVWFYIYVYGTNIVSKPRAPCSLEVSSLKGGLSIPGLLSWRCLGNSPAAKPRVAPGGVQCGLGAARSEHSHPGAYWVFPPAGQADQGPCLVGEG